MKRPKVQDLVRAYQDLERVLKKLKRQQLTRRRIFSTDGRINIRKLIDQLSYSKKRLERKIGNTILLEKQRIKRSIRAVLRE